METISRDDARRAGLKHYFTGQPCVHGHVDKRLVSNNGCMECTRIRAKKARALDPALHREKVREYQARNPEKRKAWDERHRQNQRERYRVRANEWYWANRERALQKRSEWKRENRAAANAIGAKRKSAKLLRTPVWFGELYEFVWQEAHRLSRLRAAVTGFKWAVDHMEPLQGSDVSGLHVWNNCQVIPERLNLHKQNRRMLTEECQWLKAI